MKFLISEKLSQHKYKTPEGYLVCIDAILARTGKQSYRRSEVFADGDDEIIEIDRLPEEVFSAQTLASFENKPITVEHPDEDVNSENYKEYAVGFVRDVHRGVVDGQEVILGTLVITDAQTIEEIENGEHTDLSCGYDCDIVDEANPQQRNIRGNHVALCAEGRAGNARIVDSKKVKDEYQLNTVSLEKIISQAKNKFEADVAYNTVRTARKQNSISEKDYYILLNKAIEKQVMLDDLIKDYRNDPSGDLGKLIKTIEDLAKTGKYKKETLLNMFDNGTEDILNGIEPSIKSSYQSKIEIARKDLTNKIHDNQCKDDKSTKVVFVNNRTKIVQAGTQGRTYAQKVGSSWYIMRQGQTLFRANNESDAYDNVRAAADINDSIKDVNPREGETKEEFISRFMSETKEEYPEEKQRFAVANNYWEKKDMKDEMSEYNVGEKVKHLSQNTIGIIEKIYPNGNIYVKWNDYIVYSDGSRAIASEIDPKITKVQKLSDSQSCKNTKDALNFDRIAECDFCGEKTDVAITHYGTSHYNRLVCKECAKELKIEDSQSCKDTYYVVACEEGDYWFDENGKPNAFEKAKRYMTYAEADYWRKSKGQGSVQKIDFKDSKCNDEYESFIRKWVADYKFGNSLVHLFKFIRKNDPSYAIYTTDPNGNQSMGSSENEAIRLKEKWTGEKAVLVERNMNDSMKDAVLTPADKQMIDDVISTVKIKTLANILDALNEQIPGFVGSYGQCVIEYINSKGIKDSKCKDSYVIATPDGSKYLSYQDHWVEKNSPDVMKFNSEWYAKQIAVGERGLSNYKIVKLNDSKMYEIKWKSGKDSYKSTLSGKGLNDAINKFKDSLKSRGLKSGSIEIKSIKFNDSIVELNSKLDKVITKDLDKHMTSITLMKVTKDSKVKDAEMYVILSHDGTKYISWDGDWTTNNNDIHVFKTKRDAIDYAVDIGLYAFKVKVMKI